jgi:hypothetical protein
MLARGRRKLLRRQPAARQHGRLRERDGAELACLRKLGIDKSRVCAGRGLDGEMVGARAPQCGLSAEDGVGCQREKEEDCELHVGLEQLASVEESFVDAWRGRVSVSSYIEPPQAHPSGSGQVMAGHTRP